MVFRETESIELKRVLTEKVERALVAFLNTQGGTIYIGVEDDGTIVGVDKLDETLKDIADIITTQILPNPQEYVELGTKFIDGKHIVEIKVNKGRALYYIKKYGRSASGCYIRIGTSNRSMTEEQIEKSLIDTLELKERSLVDVPCLNQDLMFDTLKTYLRNNKIHINEKTFNINYHLVTQDGKYNKMAFLLADENDISIKVAVFKGNDKTKFAKRNEYGFKCLLASVDKVLDYCDTINDTYVDVGASVRKEKKMFNMDAFKEAWINACVHNSWLEGTPPAVYLFDDRLEIVSIGGIPKTMTKEQFLSGQSNPVNDELMRVFMACGLVEQSGHGVPLVVEEYGENAYHFDGNFIKVVIPFDKSGFTTEKNYGVNYGVNSGVKLSETQNAILNLFKNDSRQTIEQISVALGKSKSTIEKAIRGLKEKGLIERVGSDKTGYWKVIE